MSRRTNKQREKQQVKKDEQVVEEVVEQEQPVETTEENQVDEQPQEETNNGETPDEVVEEQPEQQEESDDSKDEEQPEPKGEVVANSDENGNITVDKDVYTREAIAKLLTQPGMNIEEKLKLVAEKGVPAFSTLVARILGYVDTMSNAVTVSVGAAKNYDLYNALASVVNTPEYSEFKLKYDLVNLAFKVYGGEGQALNEFQLHRFLDDWKWGKPKLLAYQNLVTITAALCDRATREKELELINIDNVFKVGDIDLSPAAVENIKKYYAE